VNGARALALAGLLLCVQPAQAMPAAQSAARPADTTRAIDGFVLDGEISQGRAILGTAPVGARTLTLDGVAVPVEPDGRFLIAFDRDAPPTAVLTARLPDGSEVRREIAVVPRAWRLERVNAPLLPSKSAEAFLALRRPELEQIEAARAIQSATDGWRQHFAWPRKGRVSGVFGSQRIYIGGPGAYHSGVDIAAATGEKVYAPADGVVVLAADHPFTLEGNLLMIDHGMGLNSAFLHLSRIDVRPGDRVAQGQLIGLVGATGRATGPHLHWSMKWRDARIDPALLTGPMPGG